MKNHRKLWKYLSLSPAIFGTVLVASSTAVAGETGITAEAPKLQLQENINKIQITPAAVQPASENQTIAQVTSVSQLSDVQPTDWAFQALQSLVERYGCIAGYPDGTYRGNRAMTRYEFAAGLNACLDRVNELIATATANLVNREDLATLQRLQEEFAAELATLRGRVDALEARTSELEANQFSTTTKLQGQVVATVTDVLSSDRINGEDINGKNTALGARSRLEFVTSFTGKDTLFTRIQANNIVSPDIKTPEGSLFFAGEDGTTDAVIDALWYSFPLSDRTEVKLIANAGAGDDITNTVNPFDGDGAFGALSTFGSRNSIYYQLDGTGLGIHQEFGDTLKLDLGYLATTANDPTADNGLFNGSYAALAQLVFTPSDRLTIALTYINSYNEQLGTGSNRANPRSFLTELTGQDVPISSNSYGIEANFRISNQFFFGGWVGYTNTRNLSTLNGTIDRGEADIWNYAVTLGFPDLGKKGNMLGVIAGMEPKVTNSSINELPKDRDTSYHLEAFYQYQLTDNITITPGVIWLTAPDHNDNNNDVVIGAVRTTFSF
ncbi:MAG: iron uptake porin [Nostocaceae cyanobacterium]|nr:iron uptake porin [Nostocaceae cyanobacterium]